MLITIPVLPQLWFILLLLLNFPCALATSVLQMSLPDIARQATYIFYGQVIGNEVKSDPDNNTVATYTTFKVLDNIKGNTSATYTIKQLGGQLPGSPQKVIAYGIPSFELYREYVVFLPEKSRIGFSSPVGLGQGSYSVYRENGIAKVQVNLQEQKHKTIVAEPSRQPKSYTSNNMPLKTFIKKIRKMLGEK